MNEDTMIVEYNEILDKTHTVKFKNSLFAQCCEDWVIVEVK